MFLGAIDEPNAVLKKEWLANVLVVKDVKSSKYNKQPQAKNGVLIFVIQKQNNMDALQLVKKLELRKI
mgnify:FL=1